MSTKNSPDGMPRRIYEALSMLHYAESGRRLARKTESSLSEVVLLDGNHFCINMPSTGPISILISKTIAIVNRIIPMRLVAMSTIADEEYINKAQARNMDPENRLQNCSKMAMIVAWSDEGSFIGRAPFEEFITGEMFWSSNKGTTSEFIKVMDLTARERVPEVVAKLLASKGMELLKCLSQIGDGDEIRAISEKIHKLLVSMTVESSKLLSPEIIKSILDNFDVTQEEDPDVIGDANEFENPFKPSSGKASRFKP